MKSTRSLLRKYFWAIGVGAGALLATLLLSACSGGSSDGKKEGGSSSGSKRVQLMGSGASFPFPIYSKWFRDFSRQESNIRVDYQAKGSGAGIQDFINGVVDFAASDAAMSDSEIAKVKQGVVLLPMTAGEVVLAYNLDGVTELNLPRDIYPDIFLGKINRWNDPRIVSANPGVNLPDRRITVVARSDSSGTSYVFTGHLAAISPDFNSAIGQSKAPNWPNSANFVKAPKNDGVAAQIRQNPGAIGYVEYGFAKLTGLPVAQLENQAGNFIAPGPEAGAAALASAEFPTGKLPDSQIPNLIVWAPDPPGADAYPIASFTWLLIYAEQDDNKAAALRKLVDYMLSDEAQDQADGLGYIPLPKNVRERVRKAAKHIR